MNNKKTAKILVLILTLVLLIGSAVCVIASAEDDKTPEIISQNIAYDEVFALMYAVDAATVNAAPVTLDLYYDDPATGAEIKKSYTAAEPTTIRINGNETSAYVFTTEGVAAKYLTDDFYVQATDAAGAVSEVERYSVLEYCLQRLYGGPSITEGQKLLYESVIDLASYSQRVLINEKNGDTDTTNDVPLANTYSLVTVSGGVILEAEGDTDGYSHGIYPQGTKIYPYAEGTVNPWAVTTYDAEGNKTTVNVENGGEFTTSGVYTEISERVPTPGEYYATYGGLGYDDITYIKAYEISGSINRATYQVQDPNTESAYTDARDYIVLYDDNGNNVMKFATKENEQNAKASIYIFDTHEREGNCLVFETKIKVDIDKTTATTVAALDVPQVAYFQIANATPNGGSAPSSDAGVASSGFVRIYAKIGDDGELHYYMNHTNYATDANICNADAELTAGWHTFTAEMYENGWVKCYVDGVFVGESKCISNADLNGSGSNGFLFSNANSIKIQFANSSIGGDIDNSSIYFDNTFLSRVDKDYVAE